MRFLVSCCANTGTWAHGFGDTSVNNGRRGVSTERRVATTLALRTQYHSGTWYGSVEARHTVVLETWQPDNPK